MSPERARPDFLTPDDLPVDFGRYTLIELLGEGGMARVFRAELRGPAGFRKALALKVVRASVAMRDAQLRAALQNEARLGGLLHHPNVVETYDFGVDEDQPWIAMELVEGISLDSLLACSGSPPLALGVDIAAQVALGLDHAHNAHDGDRPADIVHRDLKPANVMINRDGIVKVMDFGIAKAITNAGAATGEGLTKGTPAYMSPEQAMGEPVDGRSDLFSLGTILFELITGERLFVADNVMAVMMAVTQAPDRLRRRPEYQALVDEEPVLAELLAHLLSRSRDDRLSDVHALGTMLQKIAQDIGMPPGALRSWIRSVLASRCSAPGAVGSDTAEVSIELDAVDAPQPPAWRPAHLADAPPPPVAVGPTRQQPHLRARPPERIEEPAALLAPAAPLPLAAPAAPATPAPPLERSEQPHLPPVVASPLATASPEPTPTPAAVVERAQRSASSPPPEPVGSVTMDLEMVDDAPASEGSRGGLVLALALLVVVGGVALFAGRKPEPELSVEDRWDGVPTNTADIRLEPEEEPARATPTPRARSARRSAPRSARSVPTPAPAPDPAPAPQHGDPQERAHWMRYLADQLLKAGVEKPEVLVREVNSMLKLRGFEPLSEGEARFLSKFRAPSSKPGTAVDRSAGRERFTRKFNGELDRRGISDPQQRRRELEAALEQAGYARGDSPGPEER